MSIFSLINFKKDFKTVFSEVRISKLLTYIKVQIISQVKSGLSGDEKKAKVDNAVIEFINSNLLTKNKLVNTLINILIGYVPVITQYIYEYLKRYVDGLTEV
jgi:hypothetical protein